MIAEFKFGIDTQKINVVAGVPTEVIFGDATHQAIITGFYMEDFQGNYVAQWKFSKPATLDRIILDTVNTGIPQATITVYGGIIENPQVQQVINII